MDLKKRDFLAAIGLGAAAIASEANAQDNVPTVSRTPGTGPGARPAPRGVSLPPVSSGVQPSSVDLNYKPRRINKVIELWEDGQPIYYTGVSFGQGVDPYSLGVRMARTYADAITIDFEHGPMDFVALREFNRGLRDGGPTRSGHLMPCTFVTSGVIGLNEEYALANSWFFTQCLDAGCMGVHVCHARDPKAIEVIGQMAMRYPFLDYPDTPKLARRGLRGSSASFAAQLWDCSPSKYCRVADIYPLNPHGEIILGIKIEDTFADANVEKTMAVPGVAFAEYGPGDHSYWLYGLSGMPPAEGMPPLTTPAPAPGRPELAAVRQRVLDLSKKNNVKFLNAANPNTIVQMIKDGAMVIEGGEAAAIVGREYSKRKMPV